jgi:hypothetical protein
VNVKAGDTPKPPLGVVSTTPLAPWGWLFGVKGVVTIFYFIFYFIFEK